MNKKTGQISLKQARQNNKLDQFIKEHEKDACGDSDRADEAISNMVNGTKPERSIADVNAEKKKRKP